MNLRISPAPVRKSVLVKAPPAKAFEVFAARMGSWWPKSHSVGAAPQVDVVVEPRAGGRWYERNADGSECPWGHVLAWEPPSRLLLAWQLNAEWQFDKNLVTEVELRFIAEGADMTRVELEHRLLERMGKKAEEVRTSIDSPGGWSGILEGYAAVAAA
jgi:uncharacterized protein YndB with AHSA1/START domain